MKFRGHETFFLRRGWLSKGMKYMEKRPDVFIAKDEKPMDILGIGANMVRSLRYWMLATGIATEPKSGKKIQKLTPWGEVVYQYDRYLEETGTLYLLHYKLVTNQELATAWYYFFNCFSLREFTRDDLLHGLQNYVQMQNCQVAERSLHDDIQCLLAMYLPQDMDSIRKLSPETNMVSPLAELGLMQVLHKKQGIYRKTPPTAGKIPIWIALALIKDANEGEKEISLQKLLHEPCQIGRIFQFDSMELLDTLRRLERKNCVKLIRTAGLDVVQMLDTHTALACVKEYYKELC